MPQTREHLAILGLARHDARCRGADQGRPRGCQRLRRGARRGRRPARRRRRCGPRRSFRSTRLAPDDPGDRSAAAATCSTRPRTTPSRRTMRCFASPWTVSSRSRVTVSSRREPCSRGEVRAGDTRVVMPSGTARAGARHPRAEPGRRHGHAGQRCAINVAGVDKDAIARGDWLADPRLFAPTTRIDVRLRLLADSNLRLAPWAPLHVHMGTTHRVAHVVPLESGTTVGRRVRARAAGLRRAGLCGRGDRFIARDAQATHTVGGGVVHRPVRAVAKTTLVDRLRHLDALERMIAGDGIAPLLQHARHGLPMTALARLTGRAPEQVPLPADSLTIEAGPERFVFLPSAWLELRQHAVHTLREFHARAPDEPGPDVGRLRRIAQPDLPAALWRTSGRRTRARASRDAQRAVAAPAGAHCQAVGSVTKRSRRSCSR